MIRLTVMYDLPPGSDEGDFLAWRLGEHQASNMSIGGVVASQFHRILNDGPDGWSGAPFRRFMTTVDWPDRESFKRGFYGAGVQEKLKKDLENVSEPVFLISECLIDERKDTNGRD